MKLQLLNEENYYRVTPKSNNKKDIEPFYLIASSEEAAKKLLSKDNNAKQHEVRNKEELQKALSDNPKDDYSFEKVDKQTAVASDRLLISSHSDLRKAANKTINNKPEATERYLVHHIDGKETNNEKNNLLGVLKTPTADIEASDYSARLIHQLMHIYDDIAKGKVLEYPICVYDANTDSYIKKKLIIEIK